MLSSLLINSFVIILCVFIHYEFLIRINPFMSKVDEKHRLRIIVGVCGAIAAHAIEVWVFAIAYYFMHQAEGWGYLQGNFNGSLLDCAYFSFTTFTTLGFGDITPHGDIRYLIGIESLTGLVLITWTASYLFLVMQRIWQLDENTLGNSRQS